MSDNSEFETGLAGAPAVDELAADRLDHEGDEKAVNEMLVPDGRYSTKSATVRRFTTTGKNGQEPRAMFNVSAAIINAKDLKLDSGQIMLAGSYEDTIEFAFSHQPRRNDKGEFDRLYQNYLKVKAAFKRANGTDAALVTDLTSYIESYPLSLRIGRFAGRNWVHEITAVVA